MNDIETQDTAPAAGCRAPASGSPPDVVISQFTGERLQRIDRRRALKTGEHVANAHGQFLWQIVAFNWQGVRVVQWPMGAVTQWDWEILYHYYESAPDAEEENAEVLAAPATTSTPQNNAES